MQHKLTDPVTDCQEVQFGGILFGTNTPILGLKSCLEYQEQHSCSFSVVSNMTYNEKQSTKNLYQQLSG